MLDTHLLEEALPLSGERTDSCAVERALEDFGRRIKVGRMLDLGARAAGRATCPG